MHNEIYETLMARLQGILAERDIDFFVEDGPEVNLTQQERMFVQANVDMDDVTKVSIEYGPGVRRYEGALVVGMFNLTSTGAAAFNRLRSALDEAFMNQFIGVIEMGNSVPMRPIQIAGWNSRAVQYLFTADKVPPGPDTTPIPEPTLPPAARLMANGNYRVTPSGDYRTYGI